MELLSTNVDEMVQLITKNSSQSQQSTVPKNYLVDDIRVSVSLIPATSDITYSISTFTTRPSFQLNHYTAHRKYSEFEWLHQRLIEAYPFCVIPPIVRFSNLSFIYEKDETNALNKFLKRICLHPLLSDSNYVFKFLTAKRWELTTISTDSQSAKIIRFRDTLRNLFPESHPSPKESSLYIYYVNINEMASCLHDFQKQTEYCHKEMLEYLTHLQNTRLEYMLWSSAEDILSSPLKSISDVMTENETELNSLISNMQTDVEKPLYELHMCLMEVINAIIRFSSLEKYHLQVVAEMRKRAPTAEGASERTSFSNLFKMLNIKDRPSTKSYAELQAMAFENKEHIEQSLAGIQEEMERWRYIFKIDLKEILVSFSRTQADFYLACEQRWEKALAALKRIDYEKAIPAHNIDRIPYSNSEATIQILKAVSLESSVPSKSTQQRGSDLPESDAKSLENKDGNMEQHSRKRVVSNEAQDTSSLH